MSWRRSEVAAVPALVTALKDSDAEVRRSAVDVLGRIGPAAEAVVPALASAAEDERSCPTVGGWGSEG